MLPLSVMAAREAVQEITGRLDPGERLIFTLADLKQGQTLYVLAQGVSGNLDPFLVLVRPGTDIPGLRQAFTLELEKTIAAGGDPLVMIPEFAERHNLPWDDDGGPGYGARLSFRVPKNGTYALLLRSALARETFGGFRLLLGLDAPAVLSGEARPSGARIARLNPKASSGLAPVQETRVTISAERPSTYLFLTGFKAGETLYLYFAGPPDQPLPTFALHDYGDKPVRNSQPGDRPGIALLEYTFPDAGENYLLRFNGQISDDTLAAGSFRLLAGLDEPEVLTGQAPVGGRALLKQPVPVQIGLRLQQITSVDQKAENYGAVATLQMRWHDPALAFSPDSCQCPSRYSAMTPSVISLKPNTFPGRNLPFLINRATAGCRTAMWWSFRRAMPSIWSASLPPCRPPTSISGAFPSIISSLPSASTISIPKNSSCFSPWRTSIRWERSWAKRSGWLSSPPPASPATFPVPCGLFPGSISSSRPNGISPTTFSESFCRCW
ncbi:MAG: hypothetical protein R2864_11495 [Syntrophotaleaceae bacterium]